MTKFSTLSYTSASEIPTISYTINQDHPPPPPPPLALFISNTFEGGLLEREDLFINLAKTMVSVIHKKLGCKVVKLKDNGWRFCSQGTKTFWISPYKVLQSYTVTD